MKKLKIFTGLINFLAAALIVVFALFSLKFASGYMPEGGSWATFGLAIGYPAFQVIFCVIAFLQVIFALYYMFAHPRVRSFYAVGCVFCALDIASLAMICYLAVFITREITVLNYAFLCAGVGAVQLVGIVLKIICLFKFNYADPDGALAAEQKKIKKEQEKADKRNAEIQKAKERRAQTAKVAKPVKSAQTEKETIAAEPEKGADAAENKRN